MAAAAAAAADRGGGGGSQLHASHLLMLPLPMQWQF